MNLYSEDNIFPKIYDSSYWNPSHAHNNITDTANDTDDHIHYDTNYCDINDDIGNYNFALTVMKWW